MRAIRVSIVAVAVAAALAPIPAGIVERWYSRAFYPALQPVVTGVSSLVPFALLDAAALIALAVLAIGLVRSRRRSPRAVRWIAGTTAAAVVAASALYLWFLVFWGLNYRRVPLEQKLAYDESQVSGARALATARAAVDRVNALAAASGQPQDEDAALAEAFAGVQRDLGLHESIRLPQPKRSLLSWYFRKTAIDGMTDPFFLEIIIAPDLLPFERPHTLAHEWAHLAGYADESEANFVAWLTCLRATPLAQYSGWIDAYQQLGAVLTPDDRKALRDSLSPAVVADLNASFLRLSRANPALSSAARSAYDTYLRANRIEEGIASYGMVVRLILGTAFDSGWKPRLR